MCCNRHTLFGVTDGVSGRKNGLVKDIFHALHDEIKIKSREPVRHFKFRPVQSSTDRMAERTSRYD